MGRARGPAKAGGGSDQGGGRRRCPRKILEVGVSGLPVSFLCSEPASGSSHCLERRSQMLQSLAPLPSPSAPDSFMWSRHTDLSAVP